MLKTGGTWNRDDWPVYFLAADVTTLGMVAHQHKHLLVAINEIMSDSHRAKGDALIEGGNAVLIDSGVFWLSQRHAAAHNLSFYQALSIPPEEMDGFEKLHATYVDLVQRLGDKTWGYIEIDQGGRDAKIKAREKMEAAGLRPIPVYHPLSDGWDYFDELVSKYDRICMGNVVMSDARTRERLIATAWERRRKYPHLWIHALGLTPNQITNAWPMNSCDSSTWFSGVRWGAHRASVALKKCWQIGERFNYVVGQPHEKARLFCGYESAMLARNLSAIARDYEEAIGGSLVAPLNGKTT